MNRHSRSNNGDLHYIRALDPDGRVAFRVEELPQIIDTVAMIGMVVGPDHAVYIGDVGIEFTEKDAASENELAAFIPVADDVADEVLAQLRGVLYHVWVLLMVLVLSGVLQQTLHDALRPAGLRAGPAGAG